MKAVKNFLVNEDGLETVEYAVMTALIIGAITLAIGTMATAVGARFTTTAGLI